MTVGEIKIESLKLMEINGTDISTETLEDLYSNENYKEYLSRMPGAITRALHRFKTVGVIPEKSYYETMEENKSIARVDLSEKISDFSKLNRVVVEGRNTYCANYPYTFEGKNVVLFNLHIGNIVTFIYEPKVPLVLTTTDDAMEIPIPDDLSSIIPYFVKADVFEQDEPELATQARNIFELMLAEYKKQEDNVPISIDSVYKQGW